MHRYEAKKEQAQTEEVLIIVCVVSEEEWATPKFLHSFILL